MRLLGTAIVLALAIGWISAGRSITAPDPDIVDISWPNCAATVTGFPRGIVGVNGGLDFRPNPCLTKEIGWFKKISVYVNTGYAGLERAKKYQNFPKGCQPKDEKCLAYNYGFNAARYDIEYASLHGVIADRWWLDVENVNSWSDSVPVNRAALQGMYDAIARYAGAANIGYYSYPDQWGILTGKWHNGIDAWVATGQLDRSAALAACNQSFSGGKVVLGQYTYALDFNVVCK